MEKWNEVAGRFSHITDGLGKPIDSGIFETVVALNMLKIHTYQSCEGHLDRGLAYPWIDIEAPEYRLLWKDEPPEIRELQMQLVEARKHIEQQETPQMQEAREKAKQADLQQRYTLHQLLAEFYTDRHTSFDCMIAFSVRGRIRSQGGDFLELLSPNEREQKLHAYQQEMSAFTDFLKSRIPPDRIM